MRPNMKLIEVRNNVATATNGHVLVCYNLLEASELSKEQIDVLNEKYIHMEVWKEIHKCDAIEFIDDAIICTKDGIRKIFEYSEPNGEFFKIENTVVEIKESGEQPKRMVCYNPKYIEMLRKIFVADTMFFSFSEGNKGTIVFPFQDSGIFAVLMPVMSEGTNRYLFLR